MSQNAEKVLVQHRPKQRTNAGKVGAEGLARRCFELRNNNWAVASVTCVTDVPTIFRAGRRGEEQSQQKKPWFRFKEA
jgi:hypothetical protein